MTTLIVLGCWLLAGYIVALVTGRLAVFEWLQAPPETR